MIRAIIVDDEFHAREELEILLKETGKIQVLATCANALEALKCIKTQKPDVIFLDIQMPVIGGFDMLCLIEEEAMPHVVFVTAYDEYALKAFEEKTLDYLLKPVDSERLKKTVSKLQETLKAGNTPNYELAPLQKIPCLFSNRIKLIDIASIDHIHSDLNGVNVISTKGRYLTDLSLKVLETNSELVRCHRQYLVNMDRIDELSLLGNGLGTIKTLEGSLIPVSRRYLKKFKSTLRL